MLPDGEYRCPNCLKRDRTGLRLAWEQIGVRYEFGALLPDVSRDPLNLICLYCFADNVAGLYGERGLVARITSHGLDVLK